MSTMSTAKSGISSRPDAGDGFEQQIRGVVERLRTAIRSLIEAVPGITRRPTDLHKTLGISYKMAWQVHRMAHAEDPCAEVANLPKPAAMERFLEAAARRGAPEKRIAAVRLAEVEYEGLVNHHAGGRAEFESIVSGLALAGSEQVELGHRRAMFKGFSHYLGVQARVQSGCFIYHPNARDAERLDCAVIRGRVGVRRLRRNASWVISQTRAVDEDAVLRQPVVRQPLDALAEAKFGVSLMRAYCSDPLPTIERVPGERALTDFVVTGEDVGNSSATTCFVGEVFRRAFGRFKDEHNETQFSQTLVRMPCEVLLDDVLVHKSLGWPQEPVLKVLSDHRGVDPNPAGRECDLLSVQESVVYLGQGLSVVETDDVGRYSEMIGEAFERLHWNPEEFHVYRFRMEYPLMPSCVVIQFDLPQRD